MTTRLLKASASELKNMNSRELLESIYKSEGRTVMTEVITPLLPALNSITNAELAASMGSDFILLNMLDVQKPFINGLPECNPNECVHLIKELTGRPIGINLEPAVNPNEGNPASIPWSQGRAANAKNAKKAVEMGVDLILITGNPGKHVTNDGILNAIREIRNAVGENVILAAGKMHSSGTKEGGSEILSAKDAEKFVEAGVDIVLLPAPGTVPGVTLEWARERIQKIHELGKLALTSIGTSQEGSDLQTIRNIALMCKQAGTDIHHIGDTGGTLGVADPENIMAYSIAIRGKQHTWFRMAQSIKR